MKEERARTVEIKAAMNALGNPSTPDDALLEVVNEGSPKYRLRAAKTLAMKGRADDLVAHFDVDVRETAVRNAGATPLSLSVAHDAALRVRVAIAETSTDPRLLAELARSDGDLVTQKALASNPNSGISPAPTPAPVSPAEGMQPADVARYSRATPEDIARAYNASHDRPTRVALALHANAPADLQARVVQTQKAEVRAVVAGRKSTRPEVLAVLAADADAGVLNALLNNPSLPDALLEGLATSRKQGVRLHARMLLGS